MIGPNSINEEAEKLAITAEMPIVQAVLGTACIICGESIPLTPDEIIMLERGHRISSKVCDKCKAAVLRMRREM